GARVDLVELDGQAPLPGRPDRVDRRGGALLVADVGDGDIGAGLRQGSGDRATDVTGAAGDEGGFTFEIHAVRSHGRPARVPVGGSLIGMAEAQHGRLL